jgi:hypothetical protein
VQHPTYLCAVSYIHDEPGKHWAGSDEAPPTHPHTATSTEVLLKRSAGLDGPDVGSGDHSSIRRGWSRAGPWQSVRGAERSAEQEEDGRRGHCEDVHRYGGAANMVGQTTVDNGD